MQDKDWSQKLALEHFMLRWAKMGGVLIIKISSMIKVKYNSFRVKNYYFDCNNEKKNAITERAPAWNLCENCHGR